jgi:hypothetical protein
VLAHAGLPLTVLTYAEDGGELGRLGRACAVAVALVLAVALGVAWVFVELAMPLAFLLSYWLFMRAIGRVANDRHGCEHDLAKALGWGALWATIYVLPVAALTWALHALHR